MCRKIWILLLQHIIIFKFLPAQEFKRNNNWVTGQNPVVNFDFNSALSMIPVSNINSGIKSSSSAISDTAGNLVLYSNGFILYNKDGDTIENGLYVNCPYGKILCNYYGGASLFDQTSIILPKKGNTYYVFSTGMSDSVANNYLNQVLTEFDVLNYSVVDMDSNNGKGKVVQKNLILADHQHYDNCAIHAIKHANGKDWWLVKADCSNNRFQEFIVREDTILGPYYQNIPSDKVGDLCYFTAQLNFNHGGTQMACSMYGTVKNGNFYDFNRVDLYNFNRCDGAINFKKYYQVPYDTSSYPSNDRKRGIAFSPNDSLLYMSSRYTIYQIDVNDTNTYNATFIHGPDTSDLAYFPTYHTMESAPDGKLYIGNWNGTRKYMSYIDKPNVKGLGCDFKAQGIWQPYTNLLAPPNMPNYGLGADSALLVGCWPVGVTTQTNLSDNPFIIYPNPASTRVYFKSYQGKQKVLYDATGKILSTTTKDDMDISSLPKGLYYIRCEDQTRKLIVQ